MSLTLSFSAQASMTSCQAIGAQNRHVFRVGSDHNSFQNNSDEIIVGRELFTSVLALYNGFNAFDGYYIIEHRYRDPEISCRIRQPGGPPEFRTLRLAVGLNEQSPATNSLSGHVRFTVYVDGNPVRSINIVRGRGEFLAVDISNARSIALSAKCVSSYSCPALVFPQVILER